MTPEEEAELRAYVAQLESQLEYMTQKYTEERDAERKARRALYAGARRYAREQAWTDPLVPWIAEPKEKP